jgi:hypothetical protein
LAAFSTVAGDPLARRATKCHDSVLGGFTHLIQPEIEYSSTSGNYFNSRGSKAYWSLLTVLGLSLTGKVLPVVSGRPFVGTFLVATSAKSSSYVPIKFFSPKPN